LAYNVERLQNGDTDNLIEALFKSKKMEIFMSAVLLLAVTLVACNMDKVAEVERKKCIESEKRDKVVVIDPGHGGEDPGKVGVNKAKEKDVNLEISKELRSVLIKAGFDVVMTRENDKSLGAGDRFSKVGDLNKRCEIINNTYVENNNCVLIRDPRKVKGWRSWYKRNLMWGLTQKKKKRKSQMTVIICLLIQNVRALL
jgi:N-acetylmuramoyl-L-alanine amidase